MDALDRLFQRLVHNVREEFPEYLTQPFQVSELYQRVIPYRHNRKELGVETNQDYEMLLTELLAGERGYLLGDERMQDALRSELQSPNPDPSAFRAFGDEYVSLAADAVRRLESESDAPAEAAVAAAPGAAPAAPGLRAPSPGAGAFAAPRPTFAPPPPPPPPAPAAAPMSIPFTGAPAHPPAPPPRPTGPSRTSAPHAAHPMATPQRAILVGEGGGTCRFCNGTLPAGRRIIFCPHCGQNLTVQHCPACGTELEMGWKFCTTCGRSVATQ